MDASLRSLQSRGQETLRNQTKKTLLQSVSSNFKGTTEFAYKQAFKIQGDKVTFDRIDSYPIQLLGCKFKPDASDFEANTEVFAPQVRDDMTTIIKEKYF